MLASGLLEAQPLGAAAAAAGCCALCIAQCCPLNRSVNRGAWLSRPPQPQSVTEPLVRSPSHQHPQFPDLPTLERAQRSSVVRVPGFLSSTDIDAIHRAAKEDGEGSPQLVRVVTDLLMQHV
jgi:hypothetical protein